MPEGFIPLARFVRDVASGGISPSGPAAPRAAAPAALPEPLAACAEFAHAETVGELARMRLAACEAFERAAAALLQSVAAEVLGRELALAATDVNALAARALERYRELEPVSLVISQHDAQRVVCALPTRVDAALEPGDLLVEVRDGILESRFAFRLAGTIARALADGA